MTETPYVPPIDYTSRDYVSVLNDMISQIPVVMPEWTSRNPGDAGMALLELFAYTADNMHYYIDKIASEAYVGSAVQRDSLLAIAELFDYRPAGTSAAAVTLLFNNSTNGPLVVPVLTTVSTPVLDGNRSVTVQFETDAAITVPALGSTSVTATQGRTFSDEVVGSSDGSISQFYPLFNSPVVQGSVRVFINETGSNIEWQEVNDLIDYAGTALVFTVTENANGVAGINFGDNVSGRAPAPGATITATYRVSDGPLGNVGSGSLRYIASPVPGGISVTNLAEASGGADPESNDRLRLNLPASLKSLDRAVTLRDYSTLAVEVPGVAVANSSAAVYSSVLVAIAPQGGGQPSIALRDAVTAYLSTRCPAGTTVTTIGPTYVPVNLTLTVDVRPTFRQSSVDTEVSRALAALFDFDGVTFGDLFTLGDIVSLVQSVPGVNFCSVSVLARDPSTTGVSNIVCAANEIPRLGTLTKTFTGGMP